MVRDGSQSLVLRAVKGALPGMPTVAEKLVKLSTQHPAMKSDPVLAFPLMVIHCLGASGDTRCDLVVMREPSGKTFAELIAQKWTAKHLTKLMTHFEEFGICLADFHARYGNKQHGDLQPSKIFYDEASGKFTMVDVHDVGTQGRPFCRRYQPSGAGVRRAALCGREGAFRSGLQRNRNLGHAVFGRALDARRGGRPRLGDTGAADRRRPARPHAAKREAKAACDDGWW